MQLPAETQQPHSVEAEEMLIGGVLNHEEWFEELIDVLQSNDFFDPRCSRIWQALTKIYNSKQLIDPITVARLVAPTRIDEYFAKVLIPILSKALMTLAGAKDYAHKIRELSERRRLIRAASEIMEIAHAGEYGSSRELFDQAERTLSEAEPTKQTDGGLIPITELVNPWWDKLEQRMQKEDSISGISSGLADIDAFTAGFQRQNLIIVAARPGMGKTAWMLDLGTTIAEQPNTYFALFSLEMDKDQSLMNRIMAARSTIDLHQLWTGVMDDDSWPKLTQASSGLPERFLVTDKPSMTITYIKREVRRLRRRVGPDARILVAIDYLQRIRKPRNMTRYEFITEAVIELKELARECDCPLICLSQLSRDVEKRQDKRPVLSDLRESGQIEQEADVVAFMYRDDYYDKKSERPNVTEIIFAKNRNAPQGKAELLFLKQYQKFKSMETELR